MEEWIQVLSHLLLHLGLGHVRKRKHPEAWNAACDVVVQRLMKSLGFLPNSESGDCELGIELDEEGLYRRFCADGIPSWAAPGSHGAADDMLVDGDTADTPDWTFLLGKGLRQGAEEALKNSSSRVRSIQQRRESVAQQARSWFIREYPLLGALASAFTVLEDAALCRRYGITIAAVRPARREIYINPGAGLDADECRFVVAHELLHVGLLHHRRRTWRHPFVWNIACDYVVNSWLLDMEIGTMPAFRGHHDLRLRGLSAEAVYDRIADGLNALRRCGTFGGIGVGDILVEEGDEASIELDEFLRRCLVNGLERQCQRGRGTVPAGLIEEVRGQIRSPIPWDVQLGRWFDALLAPLSVRRSYARPSRRQSATPEIPRPRVASIAAENRTFGVVLDTSASMERRVLAAALGSIAGYAISREVGAIRLVFCDAEPYDQGYVPPESLADWVDIRGRGGTVLQPAIDHLEEVRDFPPLCPILVVTDGLCDDLIIRREHAFLVPPGHDLPFTPVGSVFEIE